MNGGGALGGNPEDATTGRGFVSDNGEANFQGSPSGMPVDGLADTAFAGTIVS